MGIAVIAIYGVTTQLYVCCGCFGQRYPYVLATRYFLLATGLGLGWLIFKLSD